MKKIGASMIDESPCTIIINNIMYHNDNSPSLFSSIPVAPVDSEIPLCKCHAVSIYSV